MGSARTTGHVTGPIVGGSHGWPFAAAGPDRLPEGYLEEEYFLEGDAVQYALAPGGEYADDGRWDVVERERSRFRTRFVVRRPIDPARFSGTVVVHWNNVSLGFEFPGRLRDTESEVIASGSAWVGATVQKVGLDGLPGAEARALLGWDPERYGTLSILDDDASFDIFTQIADAVGPDRAGAVSGDDSGGSGAATTAVDPMGGLVVERLLAAGESQSACRLATYYNAIQPVTQRFDGFLLIVYAGCGTRIEAAGSGTGSRVHTGGTASGHQHPPLRLTSPPSRPGGAGVGAQLGNRSPVVSAGTPARHIEPSPVGGRRDGASRWWLRGGARSRMAAGLR